jgi:N6-adenosine-specific RNA methylase IME4
VQILYADPAWKFRANSPEKPRGELAHGRNPSRHYRVMSLPEICALPVKPILAPQALCALWVTGPFLAIGAHVRVLKAWGFTPKAVMFTWVKLRKKAPGLFLDPKLDLHFGLGLTTRKNCEWVILGTRGKSMRISNKVPEVGLFPVREHSRKPDQFRDRIAEYVGPGKVMVELFARQSAPGWIAMGDETEKFNG